MVGRPLRRLGMEWHGMKKLEALGGSYGGSMMMKTKVGLGS